MKSTFFFGGFVMKSTFFFERVIHHKIEGYGPHLIESEQEFNALFRQPTPKAHRTEERIRRNHQKSGTREATPNADQKWGKRNHRQKDVQQKKQHLARTDITRRNHRKIEMFAHFAEIVFRGGFVRNFGQISKNGVRPPSYHLLVALKYQVDVFVLDVTKG